MLSFGRKQIPIVVLFILLVNCTSDDLLTGDSGVFPSLDSSSIGAGSTTGASGAPTITSGGSGDNEPFTPETGGAEEPPETNPCGNGKIDQGEVCDGDLLNNETCETLGYTGGGTLICSECRFNTDMCVSTGLDSGYGDPGDVDSGVGFDNSTTPIDNGVPPDHCLANIDSYNSDGPFTYQTSRSGRINMYVPDVPAGCKVPMVHQSNGTGGNCMFYGSILRRLATNGFLALCYESTQTGAGTFGIEAYKAALAEYPDLADMRFGSTGHSQGGMAAFNTLAYAEREWGDQGIYAALPMEPASGFGVNPIEGFMTLYASIKSPVFMFSGLLTDTLVSQGWVQSAYNLLDDSTEAYFYTKAGANHIGTIGRDGSEVVVSWFRWKLLGDTKACEYFKALPTTDATWALVASQSEQPCN